jgi:hypothetical protein
MKHAIPRVHPANAYLAVTAACIAALTASLILAIS